MNRKLTAELFFSSLSVHFGINYLFIFVEQIVQIPEFM